MKKLLAVLLLIIMSGCSNYQSTDDFDYTSYKGKRVINFISNYNTVTLYFEDGSILSFHSQKFSLQVANKLD